MTMMTSFDKDFGYMNLLKNYLTIAKPSIHESFNSLDIK